MVAGIAFACLLVPVAVRAASPDAVAPDEERKVLVSDDRSLVQAIAQAVPGDRIVLAPGDYEIGYKIKVSRSGTPDRPITVTAAIRGTAHIHSHTVELFKVSGADWVFDGLDIEGSPGAQHAFHIVQGADRTVVRRSRLRNLDASIKGNGQGGRFPKDVVIESNLIYNDKPRAVDIVSPIDVVGGDHWIVRDNFIADFGKTDARQTSYGAFLKGGATNGIFERNLVVCEWKTHGGSRVGLSFGGGGTGKGLMVPGVEDEESGGIMRNNIIANCPHAEAIYLNKAADSKIYNNTIFNAYGIQARFRQTMPSVVRNNIISGAITMRAGARLIAENNLITGRGVGDYIPGATRRLLRRISDYDAKFPSVISRANVLWAQRQIRAVFGWLGRGPLGRGVGAFDDWFVAPRLLDFDPRSLGPIAGGGEKLPSVTDDFCGHMRSGPTVDLGAIEYSAGRCVVTRRAEDALKIFR